MAIMLQAVRVNILHARFLNKQISVLRYIALMRLFPIIIVILASTAMYMLIRPYKDCMSPCTDTLAKP